MSVYSIKIMLKNGSELSLGEFMLVNDREAQRFARRFARQKAFRLTRDGLAYIGWAQEDRRPR
jgi:hypothetical protein